MSGLRRLFGVGAAALAAVAAVLAAAGLVGVVWGWPDALNHFAPLMLLAGVGGGLGALALPRSRLRAATAAAAAFVILATGAPMALETLAGAREPVPGPANFTLLTFNQWWGAHDHEILLAAIRKSGADVVTLQEADRSRAVFTRLRDAYPYQRFCGWRCDTVILSKRPFLASGRSAPPEGAGDGPDFLWVRVIAPDGRPVTVATVHLFWPIPPWVQRAQREALGPLTAAVARDELVLAGDFNLTPWSFAMRRLDRSLAPLTRRTHGLLTFPARPPLPFLALDQVYAAPAWRTVSVRRLPGAGSDHYPVLMKLRR